MEQYKRSPTCTFKNMQQRSGCTSRIQVFYPSCRIDNGRDLPKQNYRMMGGFLGQLQVLYYMDRHSRYAHWALSSHVHCMTRRIPIYTMDLRTG
jgi:hypothetical protein